MEKSGRKSDEIRILMFPWLAHGHISPFIELANKLISRRPNFHVYLCSSPIILSSINETKIIKHPSRIQLIELHLPSSPDLPPQSHTTKGLPMHLIPTLIDALDMASSDFSRILTELSPDLLISDFFQYWAPKLAFDLKIPSVCFLTAAAVSAAVLLTSASDSGEFEGVFPLRSNYMFDYAESPPTIFHRFCRTVERSSPVLIIKSFREIEAEYIDTLSKFTGRPVITVAPLVPNDDDDQESKSDNELIDWLNKKSPSSVVYISFGSECYLSRSEIHELAHALLITLVEKACPISFVWVIRFPRGEEVRTTEALPEGFAAAVGEKVYVAEDWVPQRRILRHGSVGGFVSHCGWNSLMEAMNYGVPIVAMPLNKYNDQPMNASLVEEAGVGLKVEKIERGELAKTETNPETLIGNQTVEMEKSGRNSGQLRILMLPFLAHGHVSPFIELANSFISRRPNIHVYLCSTPIILSSIAETKMIKHPSRMELVELHLPSLPDLPPQSHTTKGLPDHLFPNLLDALDMASSDFSRILTELSPDLLIFDFFQHWAPKLAFDLKIPSVCFMIVSAITAATTLTSVSDSAEFEGFFPLRSNYMFDYEQPPPTIIHRYCQCVERSSPVLLIKSFREIEAEYLDSLSKSIGRPIIPLAPLIPNDDDEDDQESDNEVINWLNNKSPSSVVYISIGSQSYLSTSEIHELAHAILITVVEKACPISFVWVIRFPKGEEVRATEVLPEGFAAAVGEKVYVAEEWVPQTRILRHGSVGGFLSHCGWGSVMEAMKYGVPIVAMPMHELGDQPMNARLVEEAGIGLKVGKIERGELAKVIEEVVIGEKNVGFKEKAKEMKDCLLKKGDREIDEAIDRLVHICKTFSV
ncbi:UDP-glucosyltransferase 29 [Linum perenne]